MESPRVAEFFAGIGLVGMAAEQCGFEVVLANDIIEMWPLWELEGQTKEEVKDVLNSAEYTAFQQALKSSSFQAVLNEAPIAPAPLMELPTSLRGRIIPDDVYERRVHPDIRVARRANTIAKLAGVIAERNVKRGLRNTLLVQATRLQHLASQRLAELGGPPQPGEDSNSPEDGDVAG